jgi:hypothetical protein
MSVDGGARSLFSRVCRVMALCSLAIGGLVFLDVGNAALLAMWAGPGVNPLIGVAIAGFIMLPGAGMAVALLLDRFRHRPAIEIGLAALAMVCSVLGAAFYWRLSHG